MIKIGNLPLGFDESGIAAQISEPLAEKNIPMYYISTFLNDHTLELWIYDGTMDRCSITAVLFITAFVIQPTYGIIDTIPPKVTKCPQDIHRTVPLGTRFMKVYWTTPTAVDNSGKVRIDYNFRPGTDFPVASIPVTYTFSDLAGNQAICKFWVNITEALFDCIIQKIQLETPSASPSPWTITSPKYPMEYPINSNCQWEVWKSVTNGSSTNGILLKIHEIQLHPSDVVVVTEMGFDVTTTYSGRVPPRTLLYQGVGLSISFQTGNGGRATFRGFSMEVEEVEIQDGQSICHDGYQCRMSTICIAHQHLCDHVIDCPHEDDEVNCITCQENITTLPLRLTLDPNDVIHSNAHQLNGSEYFEWCFTASNGYNITLDFAAPGNDYLLMQSPLDIFGHDMVALKRHTTSRSLSYNGTSLALRFYRGTQGNGSAFSITVQESQGKGYCETGYQCTGSRFCIDRENDCDGFLDCPQGDDEVNCQRRCPESCVCETSPGVLNITFCHEIWSPEFSRSAPGITSKLEIGLKNLENIESGFFEGLTNLKNLMVASSKVTNLESGAFRSLEKLQYLKLHNNSLTRLQSDIFADVPNLVELELSYNKLAELDRDAFQKQTKLEKLNLEENQLTSLPSGLFRNLHHLQYLYLDHNNLTHLPADIFEGLVELRNLRLNSNGLDQFPPGIFQDLLNLIEIEISTNDITELAGETLHGLVKLQKISVEGNKLTHFEDGFFSNFTHLEGIYARNNSISVIKPELFQDLVNLTCIDLKNNQLTEIPHNALQGLTKLGQLYLSGNQLTSLDPRLVEGHTQLDKLEIQGNFLKSLQPGHFRDLGKLTSLYLSNNDLTELRTGTFEGLGSVYDLLLDSNDIAELEPGIFVGLDSLGTLDLRNNQISELKEGVFDGLTNLRHLYLSGNPLSRIDEKVFDVLPQLTVVSTDNHAVCCLLNSSIFCDVNTSPPPPYFTCDRRLLTQDIMKAFIWLQVIFAITGNLVVLLWRGRELRGHKKKTQTFLILNLAASDLLMGFYLFIIASADLHFGDDFFLQMDSWRASFTCKFAGVVGLVSSEASVFLVTLISVDRFLGVVFPFSSLRMSTRRTAKVLVGLWLLALTVSVTTSVLSATNADFYELSNVCLGLPLSTKPTNVTTTRKMSESSMGNVMVKDVYASGYKPAWLFPIVLFLGVNLFSFLLVLLCYLAIFVSARASSKKSTRPADKSEEMRLAIKMGLIVGTDFCCWVPVIIMGILSQSGVVVIEQTMYAWVVIFILPINSSINPWLYTLSTMLPAIWSSRSRTSSTDTGSSTVSASAKARVAGYSRGKEKRSSSSALSSPGIGTAEKQF
ncbi:leucine-rich repeat-containing G-protein coupled receptor 4-like isoform X2 [Patiria miniata]|nr:leucine-rich repeat-containing G-protein coupled receptor 4-like isoform X2 [Patiria miniata]